MLSYYQRNKKKCKEVHKKWYIKNKKKCNQISNIYYQKNKKRILKLKKPLARIWYIKNKNNIKNRKFNKKIIALQHYSKSILPFCKCCYELNLKFLTFHHVNNDGAEHRRRIGDNIYLWAIENNLPIDPPLQVLCMNCNWGMRYSSKCPHKE